MSIHSINSALLAPVQSVAAPASSGTTAATTSTDVDDSGNVQVSGFGQFLSQLQALEQSDPTKAGQVLSDIASKLRDEAKSASGPEADKLNKLADNFDQAAKTGNLSALKPQGHGGGHHGGHHATGAAAYAQNDPSQSSSLLQMMQGVLAADTSTPTSTSTATPTSTTG